ncbi:hypothetical protein K438DRAFT_1782862 [Mycena galopus ATCC 62051]|nr:hypothetical protein K438DRAFT_1782862 [Mycena galopus ATCC 62051]
MAGGCRKARIGSSTKVDLPAYCHEHELEPVFSSVGASAKIDPMRIQIADISSTIYDPRARRAHDTRGVLHGGAERPLPEEFQKGRVKELGVFNDVRVRILPVLGERCMKGCGGVLQRREAKRAGTLVGHGIHRQLSATAAPRSTKTTSSSSLKTWAAGALSSHSCRAHQADISKMGPDEAAGGGECRGDGREGPGDVGRGGAGPGEEGGGGGEVKRWRE